MKLSFYVGNHAADALLVRLGWAATRLVQKGPFDRATHVEAIHDELPDGQVLIASASARDGGVRSKTARLTPGHWRVVDVPAWSSAASADLLERTRGQPYDWLGAWATVMPGRQRESSWFCTEWVAHPYLLTPWAFDPARLMSVCLSIGREVTDEFFNARAARQ